MKPDDRLSIELTRLTGGMVLELRGELDSYTAPHFEEVVQAACMVGVPIQLDMERVSFMDSAGLSALMSATRMAGSDPCSIQITRPSDQVQRVLSITGLDTFFLRDP